MNSIISEFNQSARFRAYSFILFLFTIISFSGCGQDPISSSETESFISEASSETYVSTIDTTSAGFDSVANDSVPLYIQADTTTSYPVISDPATPDFVVFDGTRFRDKPDMSQYGFEPIEVIYAGRLWEKAMEDVGKWELPSKELVYEQAHKAKAKNNSYSVIDIERWPNHGDPEVLEKSIANYKQVLQWFKEAEPDLNVGYWDTLPIKKRYFRAQPDPYYINMWQENNDKLAPLAEDVNAFYPHLYTYSTDQQQWVTNAQYTIAEARRYQGDKPVFVFLWPQYYGIDHEELKGVYIDKDFWKLQLETARKYADGIVIWFPYNATWDQASNAPWWEVTKNFLQELNTTTTL